MEGDPGDTPFSRAETVHPEVRAYVYSLVNALGGTSTDEAGKYVLGDDALACLRDLKRWLKLYDEKNNRLDVARCLAEAKLVAGDLVPILASWANDGRDNKLKARVALACLEVLVPLTWPLETGDDMTVNHHRHTPYLQQAQVLYKAAILGCDSGSILRQVVRIGLPSIALARADRSNREEGIIKLMLYFIRNIAVIRQLPSLPNQGFDAEVSRSATVDAFRDQDVFALLLTICSNMGDDFNVQDVIVLDILFHLIKGVDPKRLWMTDRERKSQGISDLGAALAREKGTTKAAKRHQSSRHGRFGTMLWVKRDGDKLSAVSGQDNLKGDQQALFNMDRSKKWAKPQPRRKDMDHSNHDFDRSTRLTDAASEKLRNFVEEFLDSGFNPFFTHLRKAIEREAERLLDVNYRQFFYAVAWFLEAEGIRRDVRKKQMAAAPGPVRAEWDDDSYALVAAVLNQETFIMLNRFMQISLDHKEWQDLSASMRCFTQILLTVQEMAASPLPDDQEVAENIQNNIFYEETTHDRIVAILRGYKDQGFGYLDACTELSHVFLRLLERYSKENVDLQIRSRRRAKKRRDAAARAPEFPADPVAPDDESENEDAVDVVQISRERKFDFTRFAAKFSTQASVDTFVALTSFYRELSDDQLKRAHRFFHRVAFKQDLAVLLYRVDIVALVYRMIQGPDALDAKHTMYKDWSELARQMFKKMFKKIDQRPELLIEMLFSKIHSTLYYLEFGHEKQTLAAARPPAALEVRSAPGRDRNEQIGIVVTVLRKDGAAELVAWVKHILHKAAEERQGWDAEAAVRRTASLEAAKADDEAAAPQTVDVGQPSNITVYPTTEEIKVAMFKNGRLRLLMALVSFQRLGADDVMGASWIVPGDVTGDQLAGFHAVIEQYEQAPWQGDDENEDAEDMIRRARTALQRDEDDDGARRDAFIDDSEGDDEFLFPDNPRRKRPQNVLNELKARRKRKRGDEDTSDDEVDESVAAQRRAARLAAARERRLKIKSEAYIRDSDDESDEERDRAFFAKEEEVRKRQEESIRQQMALGIAASNPAGGRRKAKKRPTGPRRTAAAHSDDDDDDNDDDLLMLYAGDGPDETASSQPHAHTDTDDEGLDELTPLSSQSAAAGKSPVSARAAMQELTQGRTARDRRSASGTALKDATITMDGSDSEDDVVATVRPRMRAGFIVDSDDGE